MDVPIAVEQPTLPLGPGARCRRRDGAGEVYYLAGRAVVVGGQVCPECRGAGWVGDSMAPEPTRTEKANV